MPNGFDNSTHTWGIIALLGIWVVGEKSITATYPWSESGHNVGSTQSNRLTRSLEGWIGLLMSEF